MRSFEMTQPVAVITGASRGLGLALAKRFLSEGWRVFGVSRRGSSSFTAENFSLHKADLTSEVQVKNFIRRLRAKTKHVELLINNAGYGGKLSRVEETPAAEYKKTLDGNLLSCFLMCKHFVPLFRKQERGVIMNISSMAGQCAVPRLAVYSASKFAVVALSQAVAKENGDMNLKCITVCPGGMNTEMRADLFGRENASQQQSPEFVAGTIFDVYQNKIEVESGGDIVIRHGKITAIHPSPEA